MVGVDGGGVDGIRGQVILDDAGSSMVGME